MLRPGGVGLSALLAANLVGAVEVIAVDSNPDKFEVGSRLGRLEQSGPGRTRSKKFAT